MSGGWWGERACDTAIRFDSDICQSVERSQALKADSDFFNTTISLSA
jgi:hypothetical protein